MSKFIYLILALILVLSSIFLTIYSPMENISLNATGNRSDTFYVSGLKGFIVYGDNAGGFVVDN